MCRVCSQRRINAIVWSTLRLFWHGRNMDTPLHSRDKWTVKTVVFLRRPSSKECEGGEIVWQGDGHGFLGCTRNRLHRLLGKRTNNNWSVLCVVIAPVKRINQEKTSSFTKDPLPHGNKFTKKITILDGNRKTNFKSIHNLQSLLLLSLNFKNLCYSSLNQFLGAWKFLIDLMAKQIIWKVKLV